MTTDERVVAEALHSIDASAPADLLTRARHGGHRRMARRRTYGVAGAAVVVAAAASVAATVRSGDGSGAIEPTRPHNPAQHVYPGLYAAPPAPGTQCSDGDGARANPSKYPNLLLLPPPERKIQYVLVNTQTYACRPPHVALAALRLDGTFIDAGLVVEGPDAPTAAEAGRERPGSHFLGRTGHLPVRGQDATEFTVTQDNVTDVYWTEPGGGQWHAIVRGLDQGEVVTLLDRVTVDGTAGTATLSGAAKDGWTVQPPIANASPRDVGVVSSQWTDSQDHDVLMTVTQSPVGVIQRAVSYGGPVSLVTVRGHRAALLAGSDAELAWQEAPDVEVDLVVSDADSVKEAMQAAESLSLVAPDDPRAATVLPSENGG